MKRIIVANWKMNGSKELADHLVSGLVLHLQNKGALSDALILCPPFPYLAKVYEKCFQTPIKLGAQNCSENKDGAYTGEISASMLKDVGCEYVILGHSERRAYNQEPSSLIARKVEAAQAAGLAVILCIGETKQEKDEGETTQVLKTQLERSLPSHCDFSKLLIAYEPIWAIGTGITPLPEDANAIHEIILASLKEKFRPSSSIPLLYGGSVTASNARAFTDQPFIDGALIGGASLQLDQMLKILEEDS